MSAPGDPAPRVGERVFDEPRSTAPSPANDLAAELRRIGELLVGRSLPAERIADAAARARHLADELEAVAGAGKAARRFPDTEGPPQDYFVTSPVIGFANPLAPPARLWAVPSEDGTVEMRGRVSFGYAHEGPPTCVHGGAIAMLFDELLGSTNIMTGHAGMTGTLTIRYRRPTPLLTEVDLEGRLISIEGRKIKVWGGILLDGEVTAEAEGIFIEAGPRRMLEIAAKNAAAAQGDVADPAMTAAFQMARSRPSQ